MPHDVGMWGLIVGIAAILLTIPLSMVGNMLTPKFLNWWAERSVSSLTRRIEYLERQLAELKKTEPISDGEEQILRLVTWVGFIVTQLIGLTMVSIGGLLIYAIFKNRGYEKYLNDGIVFVVLVTTSVQFSIMGRSLDFLRKRSRTQREGLEKEIARLRGKLLMTANTKVKSQ